MPCYSKKTILTIKKALQKTASLFIESFLTGCGSVWLEYSVRDAGVARSNRAIPTRFFWDALASLFFTLAGCLPKNIIGQISKNINFLIFQIYKIYQRINFYEKIICQALFPNRGIIFKK